MSQPGAPAEASRASNGDGPGPARLLLVRHGSTDWSRSGRHTGRTDLPLDPGGREEALRLAPRLADQNFDRVLSSPLARARTTCELAGLAGHCEVVDDLAEWDYGAYEGRTTAEIRLDRPSWHLFDDGCPGGESAREVGTRVDRVLASLGSMPGGTTAALFAHGHLLRVLAARWLGLDPAAGRLFVLDAGSVSVLGHERDQRVVERWNG